METTCILLAGGKSSRFGRDKTELALGGERIVERIVRACRPLCGEILIVSNAENKFGIPGTRELSDHYPGAGPLGGIHAGLTAAAYPRAFVTACDLPFFSPTLLRLLLDGAGEHQVFIPRVGDDLEPLFGVYRRSVLPQVEALLAEGRRSVRGLYDRVDTGYLDCAPWCAPDAIEGRSPFYNINFPEDYSVLVE